jgi:hypothetical protein
MPIGAIYTPHAKIWIDETGIVHTRYSNGSEVSLEQAKEEVRLLNILGRGNRIPCVVDITLVKSVSREAGEYYSSEELSGVFSAVAMIVDSPMSKVMANFFLKIDGPPYPIRLFTTEEDAVGWLRGLPDGTEERNEE